MEKVHSAIFLILLLAFFSGCSPDDSVAPEVRQFTIEGKVLDVTGYEDVLEQDAGVVNAVVEVSFISSDGKEFQVSGPQVSTSSSGKFIVPLEGYGGGEFLVTARKGNRTWKAVLTIPGISEITVYVQPLTIQSTAQAEIYLSARRKGYNINLYDAALYVTPGMAGLIYQNPVSAEAAAGILNLAVSARNSAFLDEYFNGNAEELNNYTSEAEKLNVKFARDLYFCNSSSSLKTLLNSFYESFLDAFMTTGISKEKVLQLLEIQYMVVVKSSVGNEVIENVIAAAMLKALVNNRSIISDFQYLRGDKKIGDIKNASRILLGTIGQADSYNKVKNGFKKYNDTVLDAALKIAGVNGQLKGNIEIKILSGLNQLSQTVNTSGDPGVILNAYIIFYNKVSNEVKFLLKHVYNDQSNILAALIILTYLNI